jgi:hypothetical protein
VQGTHERVEDVTVDVTILEEGDTIRFVGRCVQLE